MWDGIVALVAVAGLGLSLYNTYVGPKRLLAAERRQRQSDVRRQAHEALAALRAAHDEPVPDPDDLDPNSPLMQFLTRQKAVNDSWSALVMRLDGGAGTPLFVAGTHLWLASLDLHSARVSSSGADYYLQRAQEGDFSTKYTSDAQVEAAVARSALAASRKRFNEKASECQGLLNAAERSHS